MSYHHLKILLILLLSRSVSNAQGPPILTEKPIMLGEGKGTVRLMYVYAAANRLNARFIMPSVDYNINNRIALELGLPFQQYVGSGKGFVLSDVMVSGKYQYFKQDVQGKTVRLAAKLGHSFYVAKQHAHIRPAGTMIWGSYGGLVAGMESLRIGIIGDFGFSYVRDIAPRINETFFQGKLSVGVPLLKHVFPIRQLNVYLESEVTDQVNARSAVFYLAPGVQYVFGTIAFEAFYQRSVAHIGNNNYYPVETLGGGIRFIY